MADGIVWAVFVPFVLIHLLWAIGVGWEFEELFGGPTDARIGLTFAPRIAAAGALVIFVTLARVGWHDTRLPDRLVHIGAWIAFARPAIGTLNPDTIWGSAGGRACAGDRAFVAGSHPRPHVGQAPWPAITRTPLTH